MLRKNKHKKLDNLHDAVEKDDIEAAENCELDSDSLGLWNKKGQTPLHVAVEKGYGDMVKFLIMKGANVNARNKHNETPLHVAIIPGNINRYSIAKMLLESDYINLHVKIKVSTESFPQFQTLDEFALYHKQPCILELIDEKMQQERLAMRKLLEEKNQPVILAKEKETIPVSEKSTVSMFGFRPGSN